MRRWLINKLMTAEMKHDISKELWEIARKKGRISYKQDGKRVTFAWSNDDKIVAEMPYEVLADDTITNWNPES